MNEVNFGTVTVKIAIAIILVAERKLQFYGNLVHLIAHINFNDSVNIRYYMPFKRSPSPASGLT